MAFYYDVKVPDFGSGGQSKKYVFVKWLLSEKTNIEAGTAFAIASDGETRYLLRNAGPGFLTPCNVRGGEEVSPGQAIGRIATDGELIPYGRPYVTFEPAPPEQS
jgi:hypothetical protein